MGYQYSILRKKLQTGIMISLAVFLLSGCAGQVQEMEEPELVMESTQAGEQEEGEAAVIEEIEGTEEVKETDEIEEIKEPLAGSDNSNTPQNKASGSSIVNVEIHNEGEYRGFVASLEEYMDCPILILDMQATDTVIYLDEILAYQNFHYLTITNGGTISARNMEILNESSVRDIKLDYIYVIEENILSQMPALQHMEIWLNSDYTGVLPAKELIHNTNCDDIAMIWEDDKKYEVHLEELAEWGEINGSLHGNNSYLKALYVWNEDDYNYTSYEFCEEGTENACDVFICIKDRESYGEKYFDILEVPVGNIDMSWNGGKGCCWMI